MDDRDRLNDELSSDARALLDRLPVDGSARGNSALRGELGWGEDRYLAARNELLDAGYARRWKGRGGTLKRLVEWEPEAPDGTDTATVRVEIDAERDLYPPLADQIGSHWAKDMRLEPAVVSILGYQGRRRTGGRWTRPDIALVAVQQFDLLPGKHISVVTFEVKLGSALDVTAVYEALAHRRSATQAYVVVHTEGLLDEPLETVTAEAYRYGIGLVLVEDPSDYDTWEVRIEAEQVQADPADLNSFLKSQLPDEAQAEVARLVR